MGRLQQSRYNAKRNVSRSRTTPTSSLMISRIRVRSLFSWVSVERPIRMPRLPAGILIVHNLSSRGSSRPACAISVRKFYYQLCVSNGNLQKCKLIEINIYTTKVVRDEIYICIGINFYLIWMSICITHFNKKLYKHLIATLRCIFSLFNPLWKFHF